jgi:glycosyltransferase involved in cell wall biosynthesis
MKAQPLVSIGIPVYNCERFLGEAIESVLAQTYEHVEVILVDDGSNDHSADIVRSFGSRVRYCYQTNAGIGAARNRAVELATGELLAFLDADDRWTEDKLAIQVAALQADPSLDMVFGQVRQLRNGPEWELGIREEKCNPDDLVGGMVPGAMTVKRASFSRVGPFREDCKIGEFIDWYARASDMGLRFTTLSDLVLWRRLHDANQGVRERHAITDYARVLKDALERRRAANRERADG